MARALDETESDQAGFLTGKLLVAMPSMQDPRFERAVIYVCVHTDETAMGLVVNRPIPGLDFRSLLDELRIAGAREAEALAVQYGGPVQTSRGFVLHSPDYASADATLPVTSDISLTATLDVLKAMAAGGGPRRAIFALGYAGWGPGQVEAEIQENAWLVCDADADLVFDEDLERKWPNAMRKLGVDPAMMSSEGGHA